MIEFSCADYTFPLLTHQKALTLISLLNFEWVDIGFFNDRSHVQPKIELIHPEPNGLKLSRLAENSGLKISDIFLQSSLDFSECAINHPDNHVRNGQREIFRQCIDYVKAAGTKHFTGLPGVNFDKDSKEICIEELSWRADYADQHGIVYAVEPHLGSIMESPGDALYILSKSPRLTISFDHSHYTAQGIKANKLRALHHYASHIHARCAALREIQTTFSKNETDFFEMMHYLKKEKYTGFISLEYCYIDWEKMNRTDNVSETILLKNYLNTLRD